MQTIQKYIAILVVLKIIAFAIICIMAELKVDIKHLEYSHCMFLITGIPIMVSAFHFHNIIPNVCQLLNYNSSLVNKAIMVGMAIGLLMNTSWLFVSLGVLPLDNSPAGIIHALKENLHATVGNRIFAVFFFFECVQEFGFLGIELDN